MNHVEAWQNCLDKLLFPCSGQLVPGYRQWQSNANQDRFLWLRQEHWAGQWTWWLTYWRAEEGHTVSNTWSIIWGSLFCKVYIVHIGRFHFFIASWCRSRCGTRRGTGHNNLRFIHDVVTGCVAFQVLSGGVVLQLRVGQKVWLESFRDNQRDGDVNDTNEKQIIFNGFLLFNDV